MKKEKKDETTESMIGNYFVKDKPLEFISSGCEILNCVLGGGYPLGRIVNIVGDKSTGKTLLAIEAFANFSRQFPNGKMYYHEAEASFDTDYAQALGMPIENVNFIDTDTVEGFFEALTEVIDSHKKESSPGMYVLDSLDALTDKAEKERKIADGSYAMTKQKKLSEIFRRLVSDIEKTNVCLLIISQVRDNIGVAFGEKYKRSGGKSLDFYASQILWLSEVEKLLRTVKGIKRPIGIKIKAKCKKNKISLPFRECEFPIIFGYGIDDATGNLEFLNKVKGSLEEIGITEIKDVEELDLETKVKIAEQVKKIWKETEVGFLPKYKKY